MKKLFLLLTTSLLLFAGCKEDNEQMLSEANLKQGWQLTLERVNSIEIDLTSIPIPELMYFGDQNLCYLAIPVASDDKWEYNDSRTAWSYDNSNQILNIAALLPTTVYIDKLTENRLEIHYYKYNKSGKLDLYEKVFTLASIEIKDLKIRISK